jgi:hypothetical protein
MKGGSKMDFLEDLRSRALKEGVDAIVVRNVVERLEKSDVGGRLKFLVAINSHGPPLIEYAIGVMNFRRGIVSSKEIAKKMEEMMERGFREDLLKNLNREITLATASPSSSKSHLRSPRGVPRSRGG